MVGGRESAAAVPLHHRGGSWEVYGRQIYCHTSKTVLRGYFPAAILNFGPRGGTQASLGGD